MVSDGVLPGGRRKGEQETNLLRRVDPTLKAHLHVRRARLVLAALAPVPLAQDLLDTDLAQAELAAAGARRGRGVDARLEERLVGRLGREEERVGRPLRTGTGRAADAVDVLSDAALHDSEGRR